MKLGMDVLTVATKHKNKYDKKRAKIVAFVSGVVKVEFLEGEAKGERLKKAYQHLLQIQTPFERAQSSTAASSSAQSGAEAAPSSEPPQAPKAQAESEGWLEAEQLFKEFGVIIE